MSENTPHNPLQGDSAAGGYGYDAGARPAQDASLTGQSAQAAQPVQPTQPTQQGAPAYGAQVQQPVGQSIPPVQGQPYPGAQPGMPSLRSSPVSPARPTPVLRHRVCGVGLSPAFCMPLFRRSSSLSCRWAS